MWRRVFINLVAAVSLLLCVVSLTLWVRSHIVADQLSRGGVGWYVLIDSDHGVLAYVIADESTPLDPPYPWRRSSVYGATFGGGFDATVGSSVSHWTSGTANVRQRAWWVSHWVICAATIWLPLWCSVSQWKRKHKQRLKEGRCVNCGYDLRGTPNRCPECGMVPKKDPVMPRA